MRDRNVLVRLGMCLIAVLILTVVVEGWRSPFAFRTGDRPDHGIQATVDFQRVNTFETDQRRQQAEDRVPLYFRRRPMPVETLTAQLRSDFLVVADSETLGDLPVETVRFFALTSESNNNAPTRFHALRQMILAADADGQPGSAQMRTDRVEGMLAEFQRLLSEIDRTGIIDSNDVSTQRIRTGQGIVVTGSDSEGDLLLSPTDVRIESFFEKDGPLTATWESTTLLADVQPEIEAWLRERLLPTLQFDRIKTQAARRDARADVPVVYEDWYLGQVLVGPGEIITDESLALLRDEYEAAQDQVPTHIRIARIVTVFLMIVVLAAINGYYLVRNESEVVRSLPRLATYLSVIVVAVAAGRILAPFPLRPEVMPVVLAAMIFAVAYDQILAALTAITISVILTLSLGADLTGFVILISVSATTIIQLTRVTSRSTLVRVGSMTGAAYVVVFTGLRMLEESSLAVVWSDTGMLFDAMAGFGWCLAAGMTLTVSLPFIERSFGVVTDISLLELSDVSHPLLQELVRRAPGTYNHSISVATIGESAAESIGANGLLVRVGAYFHDVGKTLKPEYFIENMGEDDESRHEKLAPAMSTLIIIGHVKDGVDLARQHNLPQPMIDFIEQHHGTTLVQYFYHEATRKAGAEPDRQSEVEESSFRYPGPKPQSREAGVMMLADAVESASRTLSEPTPRRIESLVHEITMARLLEGQFEESHLTLTEIHTIEESLIKSLTAIYHGRIKYPEQRTA